MKTFEDRIEDIKKKYDSETIKGRRYKGMILLSHKEMAARDKIDDKLRSKIIEAIDKERERLLRLDAYDSVTKYVAAPVKVYMNSNPIQWQVFKPGIVEHERNLGEQFLFKDREVAEDVAASLNVGRLARKRGEA